MCQLERGVTTSMENVITNTYYKKVFVSKLIWEEK